MVYRSEATELETMRQIAEMKRICSVIDTSLPDSGSACLIVVSACQGEGKTLISAGIASLVAGYGKPVLGIDLNWHAPALHNYFALNRNFDLEDLRTGESLLGFVQPSGIENLDILTAPRSTANERARYLSGAEIIEEAREGYEMVVVDTAAILPTNRSMVDPVTFSNVADGVLLVVLNCVTPRQDVRRAQMILEASGAKMMGAVVNHWKNLLI